MENTSKRNSHLSEREIAYYRRRQQYKIHSEIAKFFANEAENGRITRKEIARLLGKDPAQITRWLSSPTNLESDTISDLLLAMGAEMDHHVSSFSDRRAVGYSHPVFAEVGKATTGTNAPAHVSFERYVERLQSEFRLEIKLHEEAGASNPPIKEVHLEPAV
jgi:transcriptional regulator with XRE-family HTH domain